MSGNLALAAAAIACSGLVPLYAQDSVTVFRSASDLVIVPLTVTDRSGRFVSGLRAAAFELFDEGTRRPIAQFSADECR